MFKYLLEQKLFNLSGHSVTLYIDPNSEAPKLFKTRITKINI